MWAPYIFIINVPHHLVHNAVLHLCGIPYQYIESGKPILKGIKLIVTLYHNNNYCTVISTSQQFMNVNPAFIQLPRLIGGLTDTYIVLRYWRT